MYCVVSREALISTLTWITKVVSRRSSIPILSTAKLTIPLSGIGTLEGTDMDSAISVDLPADNKRPGMVTFNPHALLGFAKKSPRDKLITLDYDLHGNPALLRVACGSATAQLPTLDVADFPSLPQPEPDHEEVVGIILASDQFVRWMEHPFRAVSTDETRYYLNGVYLHNTVDDLTLPVIRAVGSDGRRLHLRDLPETECSLSGPGGHSFGVIWSRHVVNLALRIAAKAKTEQVRIRVTPERLMFTCGTVTLWSKTVDGSFPDYMRVIPKSVGRTLHVSPTELGSVVATVGTTVFGPKGSGAVKVSVGGGGPAITIHAHDSSSGDQCTMPVGGVIRYQDAPFEIDVNHIHFAEALLGVEGDAEIVFDDEHPQGGPFRINSMNDARFLSVVMPIPV